MCETQCQRQESCHRTVQRPLRVRAICNTRICIRNAFETIHGAPSQRSRQASELQILKCNSNVSLCVLSITHKIIETSWIILGPAHTRYLRNHQASTGNTTPVIRYAFDRLEDSANIMPCRLLYRDSLLERSLSPLLGNAPLSSTSSRNPGEHILCLPFHRSLTCSPLCANVFMARSLAVRKEAKWINCNKLELS